MVDALALALRRIRRRPLMPLAIVALAAIANSLSGAIFSVTDALYLRRSPFTRPEELFVVGPRSTLRASRTPDAVSQTMAREIATLAGVRQVETAGTSALDASSGAEDMADLRGAKVTVRFFELLGVRPVVGRLFQDADLGQSGDLPILVSSSLWRSRFGAAPSVVGSLVRMGSVSYRVVGVLPDQVRIPFGANVWILSDPRTLASDAYFRSLVAVVRGAPSALRNLGPTSKYVAQPLDQYLEPTGGLALTLLGTVSVLVLMAMWSQMAGLHATQVLERENEIQTRLTLGATPGSIRLLFLTDALVLMLATLVLSLAFVPAAQLFLRSTLPASLTERHDLPLDIRAFIVVAVLAMSSALAQGVSLFRVARPGADGSQAFRQHGGIVGAEIGGPRAWLLGGQFAAATALLYLCGLAAHSGAQLLEVDSGFDASRTLALPLKWEANQQVMANRYAKLAESVAALPEVTSVAGSSARPLGGVRFTVPLSMAVANDRRLAELVVITPGYFATLRIKLVAGRDFSPDDRRGQAPVGIVNARAAALLGGTNAILGKTLPLNGGLPVQVVGVVADARTTSPDLSPGIQLYVPAAQGLQPGFLLARVESPRALPRTQVAISALASRLDPEEAPRVVLSLATVQDQFFAPYRGRLALLFAVSASAIAVTAIGLFGAVQDLVSRQTRTIAIRLAMGAGSSQIVSAIVRRVVLIAALGGGVGLAVGAAAGRAAQSLLFGVSAIDAFTGFLCAAILAIVLAIAVAIPIKRALQIEPAVALRDW